MAVSSREQLKQYALRALGAPVIEINVDDDQLEDRIDEALQYWRLYHHEGIEKVYLKHKVNASKITINGQYAAAFTGKVTGSTSAASGYITTQADGVKSTGNTIIVRDVDPEVPFQIGDVVSDGATGAVVTAFEIGEVDSHFIQVPDLVFGIVRVLPYSSTQTSKSMFDVQYQLRLNDLYDLASTSIIYYKMVMSHLSLLDIELNGKPQFRFNRLQSRLYLDINWKADISPGEYIVAECYRALDPNEFNKVWNETWLKHYVTALFKRQWGVNLKKFANLELPGGVKLNGNEIWQEAVVEQKELEQDLINKMGVLEFFMG